MNKLVSLIFLVIFHFNIVACIEVRDEKKESTPAVEIPKSETSVVEPEVEFSDLHIDSELHVYQGRIMSRDEIDLEVFKSKKPEDWTPGAPVLRYRKIVMTSQGVLYTHGNNLKLVADTFESNHGKIISFPEGSKARQGVAALSGGFLTFQFQRADGDLDIVLRGQEGANGLSGRNGKEMPVCNFRDYSIEVMNSTAGEPGKRGGDSGSISIKLPLPTNFEARLKTYAGRGGAGGPAGKATQCIAILAEGPFKGVQAADGVQGADGEVLQTGPYVQFK